MDKTIILSLSIATTGLILLQTLPPTPHNPLTIQEITENCEGKIETQGRIIKTFYSEKQNHIGIIPGKTNQLLIMLPENKFYAGDNVKIKGRASEYREQCFIFPDEIELV